MSLKLTKPIKKIKKNNTENQIKLKMKKNITEIKNTK